MFDSGISSEGDLLDLAVADHVIVKSGAWLSYKDVRLGQGRENVKQFLRDNPDLFEEIRSAVIVKRTPQPAAVASVGSEAKASAKPAVAKRKQA